MTNIFEHSFVISLKERTDRLNDFFISAKNAGLENIKPFQAFRPPPNFHGIKPLTARGLGAFGCTLSHQAIITMALSMKSPQIVVFEDDAEFCENFIEKTIELYNKLPENWDIFFIGTLNIINQQFYDIGLGRGKSAWGTHCYMVNGKSFQKVLDVITTYKTALDEELTTNADLNCYYAIPSLSFQKTIKNDIDGKVSAMMNTLPSPHFNLCQNNKINNKIKIIPGGHYRDATEVAYVSAIGMVSKIKNLGYKLVGIEIGVELGRNIAYMLQECPNIMKIIGIDPYLPYNDWDKPITEEEQIKTLEKSKFYLSQYCSRFELIKKTSKEAVDLFETESVDYIFIDGDHSYEGVLLDCKLYYDKLKKGGIFMGHDWWLGSVQSAVNKFREENNITIPLNYTDNDVWYWTK